METAQAVEIITNSSEETKKAGSALARSLEKEPIKAGQALIIALEGDLGAGKTTFIQGLAEELGVKETILSPTFVIQKDFLLPDSIKNYKHLFHIDAYRLKNQKELLELGFEDIVKDSENIVVIEWADKIKKILPRKILKIKFINLEKNKRKIIISNF